MYKLLLTIVIFLFSIQNFYSKPLNIVGLDKLTLQDLQTLTSINLSKNDYDINEINTLIEDLFQTDLIYDVNLNNLDEKVFILELEENKLIQNIYILNNEWVDDEDILGVIKSKNNSFINKNKISSDVALINSIYKVKGFREVSTIAKIEKFSENKVNLIFEIYEGGQSKLNLIKFVGNDSYSDRFLSSQINSQDLSFYNIFKSGSNLNPDIFNFDSKKIENFYRDNGFLDVNVSYELESNALNLYTLYFYINEGSKYEVANISYFPEINSYEFISYLEKDFIKKLNKNDSYYDKGLISDYLEDINKSLIFNNISNFYVDYQLQIRDKNVDLNFIKVDQASKVINKINIYGNSITKEKTIRSKILLEPGDYYNQYLVNNSLSNMNKFSYINKVDFESVDKDGNSDLNLTIEEETKTGNVLLAGTYDSDTNLGLMFGIEDKNFAGTGNILDLNFKINSEDLKYDLNYTQFPLTNPFLSNTYTVYNQENDYTSSFGYKASKQGLGYSIKFADNSEVSYRAGVSYENAKGYAAKNNSVQAISDNIGNFQNINFKFNVNKDSTNDIFNPTDGHYNNLNFTISPTEISDDPYAKLVFTNKNYFTLKNSKNFVFFNNRYGYAESLKSKLRTINGFSLGGTNFKGFDFRGIGPISNNIYLGGNQVFTSTLGYGSSFLFDEKDNVNIKLFLTSGSIWDSDYASENDFELRSSAGVSLDFITAIGPISFSYANPISKETSDKERHFSFTIGSSF